MGEDITPALQPPSKQGQTRRRSHLGCRSPPSTHTHKRAPNSGPVVHPVRRPDHLPSLRTRERTFCPAIHCFFPSFSRMTEIPQARAPRRYRLQVLSARHHHPYALSCRPVSPWLCPSITRLLPRTPPDRPGLAHLTCTGIQLSTTIVLRPWLTADKVND